jgi:hypothetical protein
MGRRLQLHAFQVQLPLALNNNLTHLFRHGRQPCVGCGIRCNSKVHEAAVVGSIIFFTSVIFVAGKPLISACLRMMASSLAR